MSLRKIALALPLVFASACAEAPVSSGTAHSKPDESQGEEFFEGIQVATAVTQSSREALLCTIGELFEHGDGDCLVEGVNLDRHVVADCLRREDLIHFIETQTSFSDTSEPSRSEMEFHFEDAFVSLKPSEPAVDRLADVYGYDNMASPDQMVDIDRKIYSYGGEMCQVVGFNLAGTKLDPDPVAHAPKYNPLFGQITQKFWPQLPRGVEDKLNGTAPNH